MTEPATTRLVMKFGGTSVADLDRIRRVARLVAAEVATGKQVAVVVSAMSGKTNELVAWTDGAGRAAAGLPESDDEYDAVVASGEQVTAGLLAMTLSLDDFVITFFTSSPETLTFPVKIYSQVRMSVKPYINAASTILILVTVAVTVATAYYYQRTAMRNGQK